MNHSHRENLPAALFFRQVDRRTYIDTKCFYRAQQYKFTQSAAAIHNHNGSNGKNEKRIPGDQHSNTNKYSFGATKLKLGLTLDEYLLLFDGWKKIWSGDNISFEYHFWRAMWLDISHLSIANRLNEDVKFYGKIGVNGVLEDGSQRCFFPTGLALYVYARTLYDASLSFEEIAEDYFSYAFGEDWKQFYMGDDGSATMYVDMVNREFAKSSTSTERYTLEDDIVTMFEKIRTN